jgi:hypothetical protein
MRTNRQSSNASGLTRRRVLPPDARQSCRWSVTPVGPRPSAGRPSMRQVAAPIEAVVTRPRILVLVLEIRTGRPFSVAHRRHQPRGPAHAAPRGRRLLSTGKDLEGLQRPVLRGEEGPGRAPVRDRRPRGRLDPDEPEVIFCVDEFGPLNLQPRPGPQWAAVSGKNAEPGGAPRPRMRATYRRTEGVRHLLAAYELGKDRMFGHVKPARPGAGSWNSAATCGPSTHRRCGSRSSDAPIFVKSFSVGVCKPTTALAMIASMPRRRRGRALDGRSRFTDHPVGASRRRAAATADPRAER